MAVKKNTRVPRKRAHSRPIEKIVKCDLPVKKMKNRKALVIAQEIKFARLLANNDKKIRDKMLKNLKKWLTVRSESSFAFTEADFMRLWKGLFYCMWMSDKPLIQEELAESLSNIVHCFDSMETALLYTKCTLKTLANEWFGIDRYRLDKFEMLARRIVRQTFEMCRKRSWDENWTKGAASVIEATLLDPKTTLGFSLHITEVYMEELAKIGGGTILPDCVTELLRPFAIHLASMEDERQIRHVMKHIFRYLIFQSDVGMDYMEKFAAWRQAGFPCKNIDEMDKIEVSDEESMDEDDNEENNDIESSGIEALDPRAGRVDVELPQLPFDPLAIAEMIKQYKFHPKSTAKTRRQIMRLIREFSELANGNMPLGVKEVVLPNRKNPETNAKKAAYRLLEFQKELYSDTIRRKRKRKPIPMDDNEEDFDNVFTPMNQQEIEKNGFSKEEDEEENDNFEKSSTNKIDANDSEEDEIFQKSEKRIKKKTKRKMFQESIESSMNEVSKKLTSKKQKKLKNHERMNLESMKLTSEKEDNKQSSSSKTIKVKSKKIKTKKFQSAINFLNEKLLNRSTEDFSPTKSKKSRQSNDTAWDVSNNDDPPTPTISPTSKRVTESRITNKKTITSENNVETLSGSPAKHQIDQIPWLLPVLTKLEDEKTKQQTAKKTEPEVKSSGSGVKKSVKIVLRRNTAQHTSEYIRQLRQSPGVPYDANRKPLAGVLKPSPLSSPVNPFYKKV